MWFTYGIVLKRNGWGTNRTSLEYLITWWESNMGTPGCVQTEDPKNASCMCHSYSYLPLLHQGWCWHVVSLPCHWLLSHNTMTVQEPAANTTFIESDSFCIQIMNFTMRRGWQLPRCISVHSLIFYQWMLSRCHWRLEMTLICFQFIQEVTLSLTCKKKRFSCGLDRHINVEIGI